MSYNWTSYLIALAEWMPTQTTNVDFVSIVPNIIDYAEQRIYRELDLLSTIVRDSSAALSTNTRNFTLPTMLGTFVVVENVNVITPVGVTNPELGTRTSLLPVSKEFLDAVFPSVTGSAIPQYAAMINQTLIIVGPWPNASYQVEVVGTVRPAPLSSSNLQTFLSTQLPDLFFAASMIAATGFQHNFGAQADEPQSAQTWETQFTKLMASAHTEEQRKKWAAAAWTNKEPMPMAQPAKTG